MAKKSRRARQAPRATPTVRNAQPTTVAQPVRITRPIRPPASEVAKEVDFAREYHYVVEDLKRIAILAGALLVLVIVLALIFG